jgi:YgiT-type zinc finger domain-containing protein
VKPLVCNCGGAMYPIRIDHVARWGRGPNVRTTGVPAWECERCHEQVLEPDVAREVQRLVREGARHADRIDPLPVKAHRIPSGVRRP